MTVGRCLATASLVVIATGHIGAEHLHAQVFQPSPTASAGVVDEGTGQAFYGTFGLNAKDNPSNSYSLYRKLFLGQGRELHSLNPVDGNDSAAIWRGVDHGGDNSGYHDPGIYLGNSPSPMNYPGQLIYFGWNRNGDDGVGGDNLPLAAGPDSNDRVNWEVSVGFIEDPEGFVEGRAPQTEAWDLWSGSWGTDGIQQRLFFTASDSEDLESSDWFSFFETAGGGEGPGAKLQSGDPDSLISGEAARDVIPTVRRRVGSGGEIDEFEGDFEAGGSDGMAVYVGVGYDDKMELSWKMELNDPGAADPIAAREVRFSVKTGNLEYLSVFDPGAVGSPVAPNETNDPDTAFTDGYFDWQNSYPIFYLGLDNGTDYGEEGASGLMGVFIPGDVNADGTVNDADRQAVVAFQGQVDTTYSRGDIDQDGDTDADDLAAWDALGGSLLGDFNSSGALDSGDLDDLTVQSAGAQNPARYDLNSDALVNDVDVGVWVKDLFGSWIGDANLDREFNSSDLVAVLASGTYETDMDAVWTTGDFNGDGRSNSTDLVAALADGGYEVGPPPPAAVPEPAGLTLLTLGWLVWLSRRRSAIPVASSCRMR